MYIYLQPIFSFCKTAESKNKIHVFDSTIERGCGMYEKLVNLYKMKSFVYKGTIRCVPMFTPGIRI